MPVYEDEHYLRESLRIKSLLFSPVYFPPQTGGISRFMETIAVELGPEEVCCLTGGILPTGDRLHELGVHVYRRPRACHGPRFVRSAMLATTLLEIILRERPQIVQLAAAHDGHVGLFLRWCLGIPYVVYAHGNEILAAQKASGSKTRLVLRSAARVIAVSKYTAHLVEQLGVKATRIEVIHPGCEVEFFRPQQPSLALRQQLLGTTTNEKVIVTVGNLVARKGQDMVIRALPRVLHAFPNTQYLVVGDGPYRPELEQLAAEVGVHEQVIFTGRIPNELLPEVYALSDVFVMPSREQCEASDVEGFGIVFLEASACGKPAVASCSGGIEDAVVEGVTGFLVDPLSPDEIAHALIRILSDANLAANLGKQGRERVVREFSWRRVADQIRRVLAEVVHEQNLPS
ncbi:MAG TPA: glycosyltransferase family 4 protein [Methylocaldum sp.]|nr:glycosyltransferase family 4 protein [Methylocaldum sp.]